ncbi:hypothetical protein [Flammeovirga kamogawensis]|uniref:Uncharacterized protein n=1 Tax=Flammeovirga kamogawensis TaxID=373891 RepID=A0ABX8H434_9BACT|nr:hypothetical protein [Flammeovirga kamogawensis]MBB6463497.1 hypothetical protein [Flammeovirga kamogawensis]QWG10556.1 hypothetical protein KM029_24545 [Flammeovirga kamogawensis]TRX63664.1 hypothetical protein EO216_24940 [Flammeovirga kamogawensis]
MLRLAKYTILLFLPLLFSAPMFAQSTVTFDRMKVAEWKGSAIGDWGYWSGREPGNIDIDFDESRNIAVLHYPKYTFYFIQLKYEGMSFEEEDTYVYNTKFIIVQHKIGESPTLTEELIRNSVTQSGEITFKNRTFKKVSKKGIKGLKKNLEVSFYIDDTNKKFCYIKSIDSYLTKLY